MAVRLRSWRRIDKRHQSEIEMVLQDSLPFAFFRRVKWSEPYRVRGSSTVFFHYPSGRRSQNEYALHQIAKGIEFGNYSGLEVSCALHIAGKKLKVA